MGDYVEDVARGRIDDGQTMDFIMDQGSNRLVKTFVRRDADELLYIVVQNTWEH